MTSKTTMSVVAMKVQAVKQEIKDLQAVYEEMTTLTTKFGVNYTGSAVHNEMLSTLSEIRIRHQVLTNQVEKFEASEKVTEEKVMTAAKRNS